MNYPLIILPQAIKDISTLQPTCAPFTQTPPPKRNLSQPQPIEVGITTATLVLGLTGVIALIFAKQPNLSVLFLIGTAIAIASLIHQGKKSFPVRLKQYERDLEKYQKEQAAYEQAKQEWEQEQALINAPDGITKFRQMRLKKTLSKVKDDGTAPNPNIGATEDYFLTILNQYFPDKIYLDRKIAIPDSDQHYSPDFAYIDTEYNLHIDIEIDEPYSHKNQEPVHYIGKDQTRNQTIAERNWVIIRFAEEQVVRHPHACAKAIAQLYASITQTQTIPADLETAPDLPPYPMWTLPQAREMVLKQYRDTYLKDLPAHTKRPKTEEPAPQPSAPFVPSTYQQAIFDYALNGTGDILVEAVAGSGKSRTLLELSKLIPNLDGIFLAFNKSVASELQAKLGNRMTAKTINSIGKGIVDSNLGRCQLDQYKYEKIAREIAKPIVSQLENEFAKKLEQWKQSGKKGEEPNHPPNLAIATKTLTRLADLVRFTLIDPLDTPALTAMCDHYGISLSSAEPFFPKLAEVLDKGKQQAQQQKITDFTDQIWLPHSLNLTPPKTYEWIFADECQDFSPCQLELILRIRNPQGRIIFVGDPYQAIYGFAGADTDSIEKIKIRTNAKPLPLSICYRCPASHIALAKQIVPHIEAKPAAPEGQIHEITTREVPNFIQAGDLIISRSTAPLIEMCLRLLSHGIKSKIKGEDIGKNLLEIITETANLPNFQITQFSKFLNKYEQKQKDYLRRTGSERQQIEAFEDQIEAIRSAYTTIGAVESIDHLRSEIELLLDGQGEKGEWVELCTIHKAKGLEADTIFFLRPDKCPLIRTGQKEWELKQEMNLKYVALTRAKKELYLVNE